LLRQRSGNALCNDPAGFRGSHRGSLANNGTRAQRAANVAGRTAHLESRLRVGLQSLWSADKFGPRWRFSFGSSFSGWHSLVTYGPANPSQNTQSRSSNVRKARVRFVISLKDSSFLLRSLSLHGGRVRGPTNLAVGSRTPVSLFGPTNGAERQP